MGKKSRKQKEIKNDRERLNLPGISIADRCNEERRIKQLLGLPPEITTPKECSHDGLYFNAGKSDGEKQRYWEQGSAIAHFGQRYAYQSTLCPTLTDISVVWLHLCPSNPNSSNSLLPPIQIDEQFVKIAHASPISEITRAVDKLRPDYELARFKTELGIVAKTMLRVGQQEFQRVLPNPLFPHHKPKISPPWLHKMNQLLDDIRARDSALIMYLDSMAPCNCLGNLVEKAKKQEAVAAAVAAAGSAKNDRQPKCNHLPEKDDSNDSNKMDPITIGMSVKIFGMKNRTDLNGKTGMVKKIMENGRAVVVVSELISISLDERRGALNIKKEKVSIKLDNLVKDSIAECETIMREKLLKFAIFKHIQEEATYRDITSLIKFFNDNSEYLSNHCNEFSTYAFSYATTIIIDQKKYEWAERVANLALLAEVFAEHGYAKVTAALQRLEDPKKPHMELYLRGMYIEMRKTDNASSILRLLQKKIPCDCLDELRGIMHAEGMTSI